MKRILSIALLCLMATGCDAELKEIKSPEVKEEKQFLLIDTDERGSVVRYYDSQTGVICYRYIGNGHLSCLKLNQGAKL